MTDHDTTRALDEHDWQAMPPAVRTRLEARLHAAAPPRPSAGWGAAVALAACVGVVCGVGGYALGERSTPHSQSSPTPLAVATAEPVVVRIDTSPLRGSALGAAPVRPSLTQ